MSEQLSRLANAVLLPAVAGTQGPSVWVRRRLGDGLGGLVLFARNVVGSDQVRGFTAQVYAERPDAVVAIDEEGGDVTRLEAATGSSYPGNAALGVVDDLELTRAIGSSVGADLACAGVSLNFAPSADVNSNPQNPVIGVRSFGSDTALVARHTAAWILGHQGAGVAACVKHFPGHGDTSVDSHVGLPLVELSADEVLSTHLPPFRAAVQAGVAAVMTAHLLLTAYDDVPATVSRRILTGLLREDLGFTGVIVTDALDMQGVAATYGISGAAVRALAAGADALCLGGYPMSERELDSIHAAIVTAVVHGELSVDRLAEAAERVSLLGGRPAERTPGAGTGLGLAAARRATRVVGDVRLQTAPLVVQLATAPNIAAGVVPWGVREPLAALLPGTEGRYAGEGADVTPLVSAAADRPLVLVVRSAHRHGWQRAVLSSVLEARPDTVVVEMGLPGPTPAARQISTYGAARVNGLAAAELLAGTR